MACDSFSVEAGGRMCAGHTRQTCPAEYVPLLFSTFFGLLAGCQNEFFSKNFLRLRRPASMLPDTVVLLQFSARAMARQLMPRK